VSIRDFSWGKGGRCVWLTNYHPCSAETSRKSGALGPPRPVAGDLYFTRKITCSQFYAYRQETSFCTITILYTSF